MLTSVGFLYLKNVKGFDEHALLEATKAFYQIPMEERQKLVWHNHDARNKNIFRGLTPFISNSEAHKEFFDMGRKSFSESEQKYPIVEETPFLPDKKYQWIKETLEKQWSLMHKVALKLAKYIAIGLGKPEDIFLPWF
jgi:isopenicillin N synthase-like dioxygenase